jgi:hypothetical protein
VRRTLFLTLLILAYASSGPAQTIPQQTGGGSGSFAGDTGCTTNGAGQVTCTSFVTSGAGASYTEWATSSLDVSAASTVRAGAHTGDIFSVSQNGGAVTPVPLCGGDIACADNAAPTVAAGAITAAKSSVTLTRRVCAIIIGADNGSALADADIGPQNDSCLVQAAATVVEVVVKADDGTPSALPRKTSVAGSNTSLLSGALATAASGARACSKTTAATSFDGATSCTDTLTTTALAVGDTLGVTSGTAGGVAKRMSIWIVYTID